jgi:transcriptional regulator with XRE-family HTH domain
MPDGASGGDGSRDNPRVRVQAAAPRRRRTVPDIRASLGAKIRAARIDRDMTARELASTAGVTSGFVSQVENGRVMPSVATLLSLASALGLRVGDLFDAPPAAQGLVRAADRVGYEANPGVRDEVLSLDSKEKLEVVLGHIEPGSGSGEELYTHGAETEFVLVLQGEIDLFLGEGEVCHLAEGDALTFSGDVPHGYLNRTSSPTLILWVMTPATY